jgi:hypothetical protein
MNSGLIPGLIAGPNRLSKAVLSRKQTIPKAEITQALSNLSIARIALGAEISRTNTTTMVSTAMDNLIVSLLPASRYRLTYRLYISGAPGARFGFTFPSSLTKFDASLSTYDHDNGTGYFFAYPDWPANFGASGSVIYDTNFAATQSAGIVFTADILTGSTANSFGDFSAIFSQSTPSATPTVMTQNSCVEVLKF